MRSEIVARLHLHFAGARKVSVRMVVVDVVGLAGAELER